MTSVHIRTNIELRIILFLPFMVIIYVNYKQIIFCLIVIINYFSINDPATVLVLFNSNQKDIKHMNNNYLVKLGIGNALGTVLYIFLISQIVIHGEQLFGKVENNFLSPMLFLLLFVFSALVTGSLVLGKPIMMYIDGQKKEAVRLLIYTGGSLFVLLLIGAIIMLI